MKTNCRQSGVTLIEILVAIGVVSILAALLFATIPSFAQSTKNAQCLANLKSLAGVGMLYVADNNNFLPPCRMEPKGMWYDHLHAYIGRRAGPEGRFGVGQKENNPWWCPSSPNTPNTPAGERRVSYITNIVCGFGENPLTPKYVKLGQRQKTGAGETDSLPGALAETAWFSDGEMKSYFSPGYSNYIGWHHRDHANVAFMDGHVESIRNPNFIRNPSLLQQPYWVNFFGQ